MWTLNIVITWQNEKEKRELANAQKFKKIYEI